MPEILIILVLFLGATIFFFLKWQEAKTEVRAQEYYSEAMHDKLMARDLLIIRLLHEVELHGSTDTELIEEAKKYAAAIEQYNKH